MSLCEEWRPVLGAENFYEVSSHGRVRSISRHVRGALGSTRFIKGRVLTPVLGKKNYHNVAICVNGVQVQRFVHRLVLEAFVGLRPVGMECCHEDGDISNNCLGNLRWDTPKRNSADKIAHGTTNIGTRNPRCKLTEDDVRDIRRRAESEPYSVVGRDYGIQHVQVGRIFRRERWGHLE